MTEWVDTMLRGHSPVYCIIIIEEEEEEESFIGMAN